jgi:RNA polymerase sigma factor (sigma-70 family)
MTVTMPISPGDTKDRAAGARDEDLLRRFVATGDEAAFTLLVQRHGPMVLGVCRRVLGDYHDAEDAFQATFAVLASKADSIHRRERLASWLYGVAQRTALKLRELRRRREEVERQAQPPTPTPLPLECAWREVQQVLDEEIRNLDGPLRAAIVLCYLEGKTHEAAARELGRPQGSMSWLLTRALTALRKRLAGRGLTLTGGMSSLLLALQGPLPVSEELLLNTLRAAGTAGAASPLAGLITAVLRDLQTEAAPRLARAAVVALLVVLTAGLVGYRAVASGLSFEHGAARGASHSYSGGCSK